MKFGRIQGGTFFSACLCVTLAIAAKAATTNSWTSPTSGDWTNGANWSSNQPPDSSYSFILITNANTKTVTIDSATGPGNLLVNNLTLSATTGAVNTLRLVDVTNNGPLEVANTLNVDRGAEVMITNSTLQVDSALDITAGKLIMDSGLVDCTNITVRVGRTTSPVGTLTLNGGVMQTFKLSVGAATSTGGAANGLCSVAGGTLRASSAISLGAVGGGSTGILSVASGQLIATNDITQVGNSGMGQMTISGGSASFAFLSVGFNAPGILTVSGGQLNVLPRTTNDWMQISGGDSAQFTVSGGTVRILSEFHVADSPGHTGTVSVIGGLLIATNDLTAIGRYGPGFLTISNATAWFTNTSVGRHDDAIGTLTVQTNASLYCLDALSIGRFAEGIGSPSVGHVFVNGGLLSVTNDVIWVGREGIGDLTVSAGTVLAKSLFVGVSPEPAKAPFGTVTLTGGSTVLSSNLVVGTALQSTGQVFVSKGNLVITNNANAAALRIENGTFTMSQGTVIADKLFLTNSSGQFALNGGTLQTKSAIVSNSFPFVVGDGINAATLQLLGGTYSFADGLVIASNATLTGCGTIIGNIVNNGTISTNCSTPLTITSISKTGSIASVSFTTLNGLNHTLEYKDALSATNWTAAPPTVLGTGGVTNRMDTNATASTRFYRVRAQ